MTLYSTNISDTYSIHQQATKSLMMKEFHLALQSISASKDLLLTTPLLNSQTVNIRPIFCDRAIVAVRKIDKPTTKLITLVSSLSSFQTSMFFNRSNLLMNLYRAHEDAESLVSELTSFRSICLDASVEKRQGQRSIQQQISELVLLCEVIEQELSAVLDAVLISY
jgi:hypothetical protein